MEGANSRGQFETGRDNKAEMKIPGGNNSASLEMKSPEADGFAIDASEIGIRGADKYHILSCDWFFR